MVGGYILMFGYTIVMLGRWNFVEVIGQMIMMVMVTMMTMIVSKKYNMLGCWNSVEIACGNTDSVVIQMVW